MTNEQQTNWWHKYNTFRNKKVKQYAPKVYAALKAQLQHYADNRNIDTLPLQPINDVIKSMYVEVGRIWAMKSYRNVMNEAKLKIATETIETKASGTIGLNEQFINDILNYFRLKLLNDVVFPVSETTKDFIRKALSDGIAQGLSLDDIVSQILSSDITRKRASLIARTEIMRAAAVGEQIGVDKTGLDTQKVWLSVRDGRTRHDHMNVDNQVVPDGEAFTVGSYKMLRPGDGSTSNAVGQRAPASEICNCRCTVARKVNRDPKTGLPLRK
jgi:uncharacterized protein with gpF-like domain